MIDFLLYWFLPIIGIVYVLGYSLIFHKLRVSPRVPGIIRDLFNCPMCISFWVGIFVGLMRWAPIEWPEYVKLPATGAVSAIGIQYIIELIARRRTDAPEA